MNNQSLTRRTTRASIISSFVLALIALFIGLSIFGSNLIDQYVTRAFQIAAYSRLSVERAADPVGLAKQIMAIYRSLSMEQKKSGNYFDYYSDIDTTGEDSTYNVLFYLLQAHIVDVDDVYLGMYDEKTCSLVYFVDPDKDEEKRLAPGAWEPVSERECRLFLDWDGEGMLYDISNTEQYGWMCTAGYPIRDGNGEICAFVLTDVMMDSIASKLYTYALKIGMCLLAAAILLAWLSARYMKKRVVEPIDAIAAAAATYVEDKKTGVERSHFEGLGIRTGDEIENLTEAMADMERELAKHEERLTRITAQEERINTELGMARQIQVSLLPGDFPAYPGRTEFDIYACMDPAREVGGDFYDFFLIDEDHLCLVIADVSGKGVPAALFMMIARTIIRSYSTMEQGIAEILRSTNETICGNNRMQMFVTVWAGILEISTGRLTAGNAGHEYPAVMKNGRFVLYKDLHSFVIGGIEGMKYKEYELRLEKGDKLFIYTDGVTEAENSRKEMFGTQRMLAALNDRAGGSPREVLTGVRQAVDAFVGHAEQFDDITMLCLEYRGPEGSETIITA